VINSATMLSNQKPTTRVNLLSTCCNCTISTGFHSSCLIQFVGWLYFNLFIHSCNTCGNSQKNTSCKSLNTYLSKYLCGVNFGFLLSFYANSISFFSSISLSLPSLDSTVSTSPFRFSFSQRLVVRSGIILMRLPQISYTQSHPVPTNRQRNHLLVFYSST
jgi:hypothetical protein